MEEYGLGEIGPDNISLCQRGRNARGEMISQARLGKLPAYRGTERSSSISTNEVPR